MLGFQCILATTKETLRANHDDGFLAGVPPSNSKPNMSKLQFTHTGWEWTVWWP